jgi:acetyl esterase/lipase
MLSIQARIAKWILRLLRYSEVKGTIDQQRLRQEKATQRFHLPRDIEVKPVNINGLSAAWFSGPEPKHGVVLYLHGGAYALGSIQSHQEYLGRFASATRSQILAINYRLAPEDPFPAALEDALIAYRWILPRVSDSSLIAIAGDSAGGGLALATTLALRDAGDPLPACVVCLSPWVDLTLSSKSIQSKDAVDPILNPYFLDRYAGYYAGAYARDHDRISPIFSNLKGLPPLLIHVGTDEILLDESIWLAEKAKDADVEVQIKTWQGLFHVFPIIPFLPESKTSLEHMAAFIASHIAPGG